MNQQFSTQLTDNFSQILHKYNKFDLADKVPLLNTQRKFLHETSCKLDSKLDSKTQDVTLFLFSDHILITRPNKGSKKKNRIIKQVCDNLSVNTLVIPQSSNLDISYLDVLHHPTDILCNFVIDHRLNQDLARATLKLMMSIFQDNNHIALYECFTS